MNGRTTYEEHVFGIEEFPIVLPKTFGFVLNKCQGENPQIYFVLYSCPIQSIPNNNSSSAAKREE